MSEKDREWIPIVSAAREGESSEKRAVSSNFKHIRSIGVDDSGTGSTKISYKVRGMWRDIFAFKGAVYDTLKIPDAGRMQIEGAPEIPQEGLFVAIPENAEVKEVKIINKKENELTGEYYVLPASKPILEGEEPEHIPKKEIYESDEPFPGKDIEFIGTKHVAGRKVAHIILYLVQYKPKSKKVKALESIDLEVVYETRIGMDAKVKRRLLRKSPMEQMILDSESIIEGEKQREETGKKSNLDPPGLHDLNNEGEYLIITTADLKDSVSTLALAKENLYTVKIVTKEEILQEFSNPNEVEAIRDFLIYATANWADPPEWVVLAGDVDKIPTYITSYETSEPSLPPNLASDHYYADLSGDLTPEIVVSRLPASNAQDMERICSIAASYGETGGGWRNKILLTAYQSTGYINCKNEIASLIGTDFEVIKKYAGQSSKQEVIATLNAGVVIANYRGHGSETAWSASNGLNASDVGNLTNDDKIPFVFSIACWNNCIDMAGECFGETWIRNEKAITFLGASRPSFTYPNHDFDEYLFDAIINQGLTKVGDIVNWAKTKLFLNYPGSLAKDNIRMYLLFGEPTADIKEIGPEREFVIAKCAEGLGLFDQECNGYPIRDGDTCKAIDMCGIQAHAGYYMIGSGGNEFEFDIDKYPSLYLTMKAEKGTDTCLLLMVHEKKPRDFMRRFVAIGTTDSEKKYCGVRPAEDCFTIKDDNEWHDYTYDLRKLREDYPDAKTVRIVQFYSGKLCNGKQHAFHFSSLVFKT